MKFSFRRDADASDIMVKPAKKVEEEEEDDHEEEEHEDGDDEEDGEDEPLPPEVEARVDALETLHVRARRATPRRATRARTPRPRRSPRPAVHLPPPRRRRRTGGGARAAGWWGRAMKEKRGVRRAGKRRWLRLVRQSVLRP